MQSRGGWQCVCFPVLGSAPISNVTRVHTLKHTLHRAVESLSCPSSSSSSYDSSEAVTSGPSSATSASHLSSSNETLCIPGRGHDRNDSINEKATGEGYTALCFLKPRGEQGHHSTHTHAHMCSFCFVPLFKVPCWICARSSWNRRSKRKRKRECEWDGETERGEMREQKGDRQRERETETETSHKRWFKKRHYGTAQFGNLTLRERGRKCLERKKNEKCKKSKTFRKMTCY